MAESTITTYLRSHDRRFILAFIAIFSALFIVVAVSGGEAYKYSETRMYKDISDQEQLLADVQKAMIIGEIEDPIRFMNVLDSTPSVQSYANSPIDQLPEFSLFLQSYVDRSVYFSHVHLVDQNGAVVYSYSTTEDALADSEKVNDPETAFFKSVLETPKGGLYFSIINIYPVSLNAGEETEMEMHFGIPLVNLKGEVTGALIFDYPFQSISDVMILDESSNTTIGYITLLDQDGHYIFNEADPNEVKSTQPTEQEFDQMSVDFPEEWAMISGAPDGQLRTSNGIFTYNTIDITSAEFSNEAGGKLTISSPSPRYILLVYLDNPKIAKLRGNFDLIYANIIIFLIITIPVISYLLALVFAILVSSRDKHRHQAHHDPLTGLANRKQFMDRLQAILSDPSLIERRPTLAYFDLDNFKTINDTFGHDAGDMVLTKLAGNVRKAVRQDDLVARLGGDEFVVLTMNIKNQDDAYAVGDRILKAICEPIHYAGQTFRITGSIGVWTLSSRELSLRDFLKNADTAMYRAKREGKNRIVVGEV